MKNSEQNINKIENGLSYRTRILVYSTMFILLTILSIYLVFRYVNTRSNSETVINYSEEGNINYKVSLKDNDYYESEYVEQNKIYIASLINKVEIDFDYAFNIDRDIDCEFSYDIYSELIIKDGTGDKEYIHKKYDIMSNKESIENIKQYNFTKHVSIDYDYYNMLASKFKGDYGIDTESYLRVMFVLKKDNKEISLNDSSMYVDIPLSERAISINTSPIGQNEYKQTIQDANLESDEMVYLVGMVTIVLIMIVILYLLINRTHQRRNKYQRQVAKLLREYDRMIVEVTKAPNLEDTARIIRISEFKELLDVRDNLKLPIMYYERIRNREALFFIEDDEHLYLHVVRNKEEEIKTQE